MPRPPVFAVVVLLLAPLPSWARGFRSARPIPRPDTQEREASAAGAVGGRLVSRAAVRAAIDDLIAAWNLRDIGRYFKPEDFDQTRVPELISTEVPRSAILRVLSIEGITTLSQEPPKKGQGGWVQVSVVAALVRTQLEFNDPARGFRRLEGINEYVVQVTERVTDPGDEHAR